MYQKILFTCCIACYLISLTQPSYAETINASLEPPYSIPDPYVSTSYGGSPAAAAAVWWEKYKSFWNVKPTNPNGRTCSYNIIDSVSQNRVGYVSLTGECGGAGAIYATYVCSAGINLNNGKCEIKHVLNLPDESAPPNTCPSDSAGNPIESNTGIKRQIEFDVNEKGVGQISFSRIYRQRQISNEPLWHHNYAVKLLVMDPTTMQWIKQKSTAYSQKSDACVSGWQEIKSKITDAWAIGAKATFVNGSCNISNNSGVIVKTLPITPSNAVVSQIIPGAVQIMHADGSTISYQYYGAAGFAPINGDQGLLERPNVNIVMWRYTSKTNVVEEFSAEGKLLSVTTPNGMKQTLTYDSVSGQLSQVQDDTGRKLTFTYSNNLLSSITTDDNKTTTYSYNASGLITDVKRPDNKHRLYHYEDSRFPTYLTGITDERGVRFATWAYDAQGRAISSEHAGGIEKTLLAFNVDGSTTVTNALNKQTIYRFDNIAGARRVVKVEGQPTANCVGANQNYTYTPEGWVASKTDWNGNKTTYLYNNKGQEISRTEAFGTTVARTINTEWHATLNLKIKVTEPDRETTYSYDAKGLLISQKTRSLVIQ